jgi:hypothetical protein
LYCWPLSMSCFFIFFMFLCFSIEICTSQSKWLAGSFNHL